MAISTPQIRIIHVAKALLGLDDADYRALLYRLTGAVSCKELNEDGFRIVMAEFETMGFESPGKYDHLGIRPGRATPRQLKYIANLWQQFSGDDNEASLNHWLENKFGITNIRFATSQTAQQAITALKSMVNRRREVGGKHGETDAPKADG